jgi:hypothetical protein
MIEAFKVACILFLAFTPLLHLDVHRLACGERLNLGEIVLFIVVRE